MLPTIEGVYEKGRVDLSENPPGIARARVLVTFLPESVTQPGQMMRFGQYSGERMSTEEDFRIAEWRGEKERGHGD